MEEIFKRLDFVIMESESITKHFDKSEQSEILMFSMCMLDRLNFSSEGLKILLNQFSVNPKLDYSSGIIIRSVLLDYLIILNALDIYGKNISNTEKCHSELKEFCLMMLCDSVRNTLDYFDSLIGQVPKEKIQLMYSNLVNTNLICFKEYQYDGSKPIIKSTGYKSPKQMFNTLLNSKELNNYKSVYEAYLFYSKYDHFGNMFYGLSRVNPEIQLQNIKKVMTVFPRILLFTCNILQSTYSNDDFIKEKLLRCMAFIDEIEQIT